MKKLLFTLMMLLVSCVTFAGDVTSGNKKFLKNEGTMLMVFDWANAEYGEKGSLKEHWADDDPGYERRVSDAQKTILAAFNKKSKKMKAVTSGTADYTMTVKIEKIDYFFSVMSIVPGHKHTVWATVTVTDKTGAKVCEMKYERFKGARDFVAYDSYIKLMEAFGEALAEK